ncbi:hypothetical protein ONZ45_g7705 [Pleurotus djamor]|nr:hypothetical protein ONZ45_g7705 [Pleurotus djamor]
MSLSASRPLPNSPSLAPSKASSSRPSLLAKWNKEARSSISSRSAANITSVNVLISSPSQIGRPVSTANENAPPSTRRDSFLPRPKKRSHKEVIPNENLDVDAQDRSRTRQRTDSELTVKPNDSSGTAFGRRNSRVADARDGVASKVAAQSRPGQALRALKERLRKTSLPSNARIPTEDVVARAYDSSGSHSGLDNFVATSPTEASQARLEQKSRQGLKGDDASLLSTTTNLVISKPKRLQRAPKSISLSFGPPLTTLTTSSSSPTGLVDAIFKENSVLRARNTEDRMPVRHQRSRSASAAQTSLAAIEETLDKKGIVIKRCPVFKTATLKPEELQLAIVFYGSPHFEIWDVRDDIFLAWPAELRLSIDDPARYDFITLHTPEVARIELRCHSKSYCEDPEHQQPFSLCESETWFDVEFSGGVCWEGRSSTINPEAGIHISTEWTRTYTRRLSSPPEQRVSFEEPIGRGRRSSSAKVPLPMPGNRGWAMKFWIPIPTHLFTRRETRLFVIESRVWLADDKRDLPMEDKALVDTAEMTISHLRRAREMA